MVFLSVGVNVGRSWCRAGLNHRLQFGQWRSAQQQSQISVPATVVPMAREGMLDWFKDDNDAWLMAVFQDNPVSRYQNVSILDFIGAKDEGGGGDNWSYKTSKAPQTNTQHFTGWKPFLSPIQWCRITEGKNC